MGYRQKSSLFILIIAVGLYTVVLTYLTWVRYQVLHAATFDMGINIQISNMILKSGLPLQTPNWVTSNGAISTNFFGVHFSPIRYLFAGLYLLYPDAITLLFAQALFLALGAIPVFKISEHFFHNERTSLQISGLYLVFPPLVMSNLYDFHALALLPFAVLSGYYFYITKQYFKAITLFLLAALIQEAALAVLFAVGLQLLLLNWGDVRAAIRSRKLDLKDGIIVALLIVSPAAFLIENLIIARFNTAAGFMVTSPAAYGLSFFNLLQNTSQKTEYWLIMFALVGFLPLLRPKASVLILPYFIVSVLGSNPTFSQFYWQYSFLVVPGLFIGLIYGLQRFLVKTCVADGLRVKHRTFSHFKYMPVILITISIIFTPLYPFAALSLPADPHVVHYYYLPSNSTELKQMFNLIPSGASVLASDNVFAHVAKSLNVYPIIYGYNYSTGSSYLQTHLPQNFTPTYIIITPSDYNVTSDLVRDFPSSYGVLAEVTIQYQRFDGLGSVQLEKTTVLLYFHHYEGAPRVFVPYTGKFDYLQLTPIDGYYSFDPNSTSGTVICHPDGGSNSATFWQGPSSTSSSTSLPPGEYIATIHLKLGSNDSTTSSLGNHVLSIVANSDSAPAGKPYDVVAVYHDQLDSSYDSICFNFTISDPAISFAMWGQYTSPQYAICLDYITLRQVTVA